MKSISFKCKILTPMFIGGADGRTPEIRAPSIKGMMRFWWRAINGSLSIDELRKKEGELFGSSDEDVGRAKFTLFIQKCWDTDPGYEYHPLPHHSGGKNCVYLNETPSCNRNGKCSKNFLFPAIKPDKEFTCIIRAINENIMPVQTIFEISFLLGGLGKRSRRGFGSVGITHIDVNPAPQYSSIEEIYGLLKSIEPDTYDLNNGKIIRVKTAHPKATYPYIKEIEIGKSTNSWEALVKKIGGASHKHDCYYTGFVEKVGEDSYRFASPVYVSVIKNRDNDYLPIITTLNCAFESGFDILSSDKKKEDKTSDFKKDILSC